MNASEFDDIREKYTEDIDDAVRILEKKAQGLTVMPEEYTALGKFANLAEGTYMQKQRERLDQERAELDAFKATLPEHMFRTPIEELSLSADIAATIAPLKNAGEAMINLLMNEEKVRKLVSELENPDEAMLQIQSALDEVMLFDAELADLEELELPAPEQPVEEIIEETIAEAPTVIEDQPVETIPEVEEIVEEIETEVFDEEQIEEEIIRDAFWWRNVSRT